MQRLNSIVLLYVPEVYAIINVDKSQYVFIKTSWDILTGE